MLKLSSLKTAGLAMFFAAGGFAGTQVSQSAELKGFVYQCPERQGMCFWHKAVFDPPKGWLENEAWTNRYKAAVLFPKGDQSRDKPMMYVRAHHGDKDQTIENYAAGAQERWRTKVADTVIEPLPDVERPGKPTIKVFLYKNPSTPDQAFELTAFMKDIDAKNPGETYFFQAVLIAPNAKVLEKAKPAFMDVLKRL